MMSINILFLAAESEPFIKIGGLGDVAGALPNAIHRLSNSSHGSQDIDIRMALPYHFAIKQKGFKTKRLGEFVVHSTQDTEICQVYQYLGGDFPVYLLDGGPIAEESPVYSLNPIEDGYKFVFFSIAALGLAEFLNWRIDILHANDWHTASAIYALKSRPQKSENLSKTKALHTLHNLPFMGYGIQPALTHYGLPPSKSKLLPEWARHAPLPLGLLNADKIVAVSPHYAQEVLTPEFGCGLEGFFNKRKSALTGIINGLDTELWDPENDPYIAHNFSANTLSKRVENKRSLQNKFSLAVDDQIPLLTLVSRMDPQKGIDIALRGLEYCQDLPWQAIILGTGTPTVEDQARALEEKFPKRVRSLIEFDNVLAHQLYAGADMFLMPSRYEPCGLSQMIAMRYGCVPIARATGGLVDTIRHVSHRVDHGTGFLFSKPYPSIFALTLKRAMHFFHKPVEWRQIQTNGMQIDFSWENSAQQYIDLYKTLVKRSMN